MIDGIISIAKIAVIIVIALSAILALTTVVLFIYGAISIALNGNVITDMLYIVQMWLPFNLGPVIAWLLAIVNLYLLYKLASIVMRYTLLALGK